MRRLSHAPAVCRPECNFRGCQEPIRVKPSWGEDKKIETCYETGDGAHAWVCISGLRMSAAICRTDRHPVSKVERKDIKLETHGTIDNIINSFIIAQWMPSCYENIFKVDPLINSFFRWQAKTTPPVESIKMFYLYDYILERHKN